MFAASLTCQTLALRPEARTPGRFLPCGTQSLPPPELQDRRVESGTEEGKVATGPEPREAYIGGTGGPGRQLRVHLPHRCPTTLAGNSIAPTSARCSRAFARSSPQQRLGFRRRHSAPSLFGLRHLVGGGKNTVRMRVRRLPASPGPAKRGLVRSRVGRFASATGFGFTPFSE